MVEPDDFGLTPIQTLAHVADPTRTARHARVWKAWGGAVEAAAARLGHAQERDPSDATADVCFESVRHTRIGCRLMLPTGRAAAGIVVLHGYSGVPTLAEQAARWEPLRARGAGVLLVRVRGFAGSRLDAGDWESHPGGWITRGLESAGEEAADWSFALAAADVVAGVRALRRHLAAGTGVGPPVYIAGESFGAALAVVAAAYLSDRDEIARLALGLPSMGDWAWRLTHPRARGSGAWAQVMRFLSDHADRQEQALTRLRTFDAAIHARQVRCPVLCKLAVRDDVVPAPAAAAVFNAMAGDPGRKWRYVTAYGHFDGGIADTRRHAAFERLVQEFLDPTREPGEMTLAGAG